MRLAVVSQSPAPSSASGVTVRHRNLVFAAGWGLGDDLMLYWAAAAGTLGRLLPGPLVRLLFENDESRSFVSGLASLIPEVPVVDEFNAGESICYARSRTSEVAISALLRGRVRASRSYCDPHSHKYMAEFGNAWQPGSRDRFLVQTGLVKAWDAHYDDTYDGWQELSIACALSQRRSAELARRLGETWPLVRERVARQLPGNRRPDQLLFFPAGGSFQDFDRPFVDRVRSVVPGVITARFHHDPEPADVRYSSLTELGNLIGGARAVITNDSAPSHLAQFFASKHVLICSRSRPGNVCFPGAVNTRVIDLGRDLQCRPCAYLPLSKGVCAAGFPRCRAQLGAPLDVLERLTQALRWAAA